MYFGIFVHCHYRLLSLELRTARTASPGFLKLGEAVRGRPPGPGLGGAQLERLPVERTNMRAKCYKRLYMSTTISYHSCT